eukprot:2223556-Prymnesium_polylepis.1
MPAARISATSRRMPDHQQGVLAATEPTHTFHRYGLQAENTLTNWITGTMSDGKQTDKESWAMTWAWRSLYACTTNTRT